MHPKQTSLSDFTIEYIDLEAFKCIERKVHASTLLPDLHVENKHQYIEPSDVVLKYLDLFDKLVELLQHLHPSKVTEVLSNIVASDAHDICYFMDDFIASLRGITSTTSLLRIVFPYTNWHDHSIIRELVEVCDCFEGVKLLDEFDSCIDVTQPITAYPIPAPSNLMIPSESSTHTVMAVKFAQQLSLPLLNQVGVMKSLMIEKFNITKHASLLLAVRTASINHHTAIFYWLIPRCVAPLISSAVQIHSGYLLEKGLVEVAICPSFSFSLDSSNMYRIWAMTYYNDTVTLLKHVSSECLCYIYLFPTE